MACIRLVYDSKIIRFSLQVSLLQLKMLFESRSCDMCLLHSHVPFQLLKSLQAPFNQFSDSCLSKIPVKMWDEEPYIGELHAVPTKFRNKFLSFHHLKKPVVQIYERENNLIQRVFILTWFSLWSIHNKLVFQLMMKLLIRVIHLKAVRVEGTPLLRESFRT